MGRRNEPEVVEGTVLKITYKETRGKNDLCNLCLDTGGRDDEWFGYGFNEPDFEEGAIVEFEIEYNGEYANIVDDTLTVIEEAPKKRKSSGGRGGKSSGSKRGGGSSGKSGGGRSGGRSGGKSSSAGRGGADKGSGAGKKSEVDWDRKDNLIRLQSCQNTAIATVNMMITHGAIVLPKKKGEMYDAVQAAIEEEASRLFEKYTDIVDGNYDGGPSVNDVDDDDDIPD